MYRIAEATSLALAVGVVPALVGLLVILFAQF
jgi:hypothetical protein